MRHEVSPLTKIFDRLLRIERETGCIMDIHYDRSEGWMWIQVFQCQELADRNLPSFDIRIKLGKYTDEELLDIITPRLNDIRDTYYSNKRLREVDDAYSDS